MDPKDLASASLPKRIIDYCYTLIPNEKITDAWRRLRPLPKAIIKSWNNTTYNMVRASPIAVNIETKAPDKSWSDGKAQLGIWITSLHSRFRLLPQYDSASPQPAPFLSIPAMPLIIVQGHDWHLLIVSQDSAPSTRKTAIWQKIDMGSTRNYHIRSLPYFTCSQSGLRIYGGHGSIFCSRVRFHSARLEATYGMAES